MSPGILTAGFISLFLVFLGFLWWHLFQRAGFNPPAGGSGVQIKDIRELPFLVQNGLPYPAGIRSTDRQSLPLDGPWSFRLDQTQETCQVMVPSCFNTAGSPLRDHQGAVWYEREFSLPAWDTGSRLRLAFLGSFYRTEVWLDDLHLGSHEGGYLPFYFDITNVVKPHQVHRLKVCVDNRLDETSLPPHLFRGHNLGFHPYGGLHRGVSIEICPSVYCFKLQVDAEMAPGGGRVHVSALFHHAGETQPLQSARLSLLAGNGQTLATNDTAIHWDEQYGLARHTFHVPDPQPWEPGSPQLYRLAVQTDQDGCETTFGFLDIRTREGKLLLNGQACILKGVCRHQEDRPDGLAQKTGGVQNELETIQNLNGNFVRLAHYPHSRQTLELCDQMGLAVWAEIPLYQAGLGIIRFLFDKTKRDTGKTLRALPGVFWKTSQLGNPSLLLRARDELLKMIERDRNHPSILFWGLGNECWTLNPAGEKALAWLKAQAQAFDARRLFTYAAFAMPVLGPRYERSFEVSDVVSVNEYFGWYYGRAQDAGKYLQALARRYPHKPMLVTETGSDTVRGEHTSEVPPPRGYSEAYQVRYLEEQWRQMQDVPTFAGLSIWVLKDFLCPEYREDNPVPFYNLKGLLDRDGRPKAACHAVKAFYGKEE